MLWAVVAGAAVLVGSRWLPHPAGVTWRHLLPGAILATIGVEALHLFTVLYLLREIPIKMKFYGTVGVSFALLTWLWLLATILVGAASLNAVLWQRRKAGTVDDPLTSAARATTRKDIGGRDER